MRTKYIWKYVLPATDEQSIEMPANARILTVRMQNKDTCIWALVDPEERLVPRTFRVLATGEPFDAKGLLYIGTFEPSPFIFHLFEKIA